MLGGISLNYYACTRLQNCSLPRVRRRLDSLALVRPRQPVSATSRNAHSRVTFCLGRIQKGLVASSEIPGCGQAWMGSPPETEHFCAFLQSRPTTHHAPTAEALAAIFKRKLQENWTTIFPVTPKSIATYHTFPQTSKLIGNICSVFHAFNWYQAFRLRIRSISPIHSFLFK